MRNLAALFLFVLGFIFVPQTLYADILELENGDRLTGTIKRLEGGKLIFETSYAGEIPIDWSVVKSFTSETGTELELKLGTGEALVGQIAMANPDQLEVKTQQDTFSYAKSDITEFGPVVVPRDYSLLELWNGGVKFGFNLSRGNTDLSNFSLSADPVRKTDADRIALNFSSLRTKQDGETTADAYKAGIRYDRYMTENLFAYGTFGWEKDGKALLDYRYRGGGGLGWDVKLAESSLLTFFGGISAFTERFSELDRNNEGEGNLGVEFVSSMLKPFELKANAKYSPVFSGGRYFAQGGAGISAPIFGRLNWGLEVQDLYDSNPPEGILKNDFRFLTTLGWTF